MLPAEWDAVDAHDSLQRLAASFDDVAMPYASRPNPNIGAAFPRYDHLARVDEWRIGETASTTTSGVAEMGGDVREVAAGFDEATARDASARQAAASDPASSVFVSANAGTGKTKLLTDRVLRLMLDGARPDSILCVTYTRAAADVRRRKPQPTEHHSRAGCRRRGTG